MSGCFFRLLFSFRLVNKVPQSEGKRPCKRMSGDCKNQTISGKRMQISPGLFIKSQELSLPLLRVYFVVSDVLRLTVLYQRLYPRFFCLTQTNTNSINDRSNAIDSATKRKTANNMDRAASLFSRSSALSAVSFFIPGNRKIGQITIKRRIKGHGWPFPLY